MALDIQLVTSLIPRELPVGAARAEPESVALSNEKSKKAEDAHWPIS